MTIPRNADQARVPGAKLGVSFRSEAVEHHRRRERQTTLPQLLGPRALVLLWLLPITLALATVGLLFAPLPAHVSGLVVLPPSASGAPVAEGITAAVILPPEAISSLQPGQIVTLQGGRAQELEGCRLEGRIIGAAPSPLSGAAIEQQLDLPAGAMAALTRPCLVARIALSRVEARRGDAPFVSSPQPRGPAAALAPGRVYEAEIAVGQTRVGALLPIVKRFFPAHEPRSDGPC